MKKIIALKTEVDKLDINKLVNVWTGLNNWKTKVSDFDVDKMKTAKKDADKLKNVVDHEVDKNTKFDMLNIKWNNLERK